MPATTDRTLADLVTADPGAARVLERFDLDYCCGGGRRLDEACAAAGVDPDEVVGALAASPTEPTPDWATMAPEALVDHLEATHHAYLHTELARLTDLADKVATVHGARHPELVGVRDTYAELRADLEPHLMKEERILFPLIRELVDPGGAPTPHDGALEQGPIRVMALEHDRAGELLAVLRERTGGYEVPEDGCASYRTLYEGLAELEADTHLHVHKENNVLFPAVIAIEHAAGG
ncbi:MAG: iron-sulfur cluster repair di-iron protein [Microthrixaceae bacterium]|nr:iron-sulfur cluster repair di-iron protein [Microthrixaceae bacterium]